jgi:broad specificity phosphatase PhoE
VDVDSGFIDMDYGKWQGISHEEVKAQYPEMYALWQEQPHLVKFPAGESLDYVRHRAMNSLEQIISRHQNDTVVIVAHRVVNKAMLCAILGLDTSHFWLIRQDTCCINIFEDLPMGLDTGFDTQSYSTQAATRPKGYVLFHLNDTCHLKHLKKDIVTVDF